MQEGKVKVCVWPDGCWCRHEEIESYSWKSDDYSTYYIPEELNHTDIESLINRGVISA